MDLGTPTGVYSTQSITTNTNVRDVSNLLDLWAHKETPFLNRISWGPESGGLIIEWVHEHLGWAYVEISGALATDGTSLVVASGTAGLAGSELAKQIHPGTVLFAHGTSGTLSTNDAWLVVSTIATTTVTVAFMASATASLAASTKVYIVGSFANEGSTPDRDVSRKRTLLSNKMTILRKDIRITGSEKATDMHAVANELQHQIKNRLLEMQFERERSVLYSRGQARSTTAEGLLQGMAEVLLEQSGESFVDISTTNLTESAFNDLVADCYDNGGSPNVVVGPVTQIRKFTSFNSDRIRTTVDNRVGGQYITSYLSDTGITLDLIPLRKAITKYLFVLDTSKIQLRAKKGRKLILEKLGKVGDYEEWQILSEYSLEHHGVSDGYHGMFAVLA